MAYAGDYTVTLTAQEEATIAELATVSGITAQQVVAQIVANGVRSGKSNLRTAQLDEVRQKLNMLSDAKRTELLNTIRGTR